MKNRFEEKYNTIEDIMAWSHTGEYQRDQLNKITMPELAEIWNKAYNRRMAQVTRI